MDTFINKIYLYDDKMTVLYNTQDSHSDVTIDELSSSKVALVEATGVEPVLSALFSSNILIFHLFFICLQTFLVDLQLPHHIASSAKG